MVSVLIPAYNAEKTINRCIESILHQTYENIEVIIVNDGSTDNTLSVLSNYAKKDRRIAIYNQKNRGVSATRNVCLKNAHGDYVLYVDADDWIEANMIQQMLELMKDADIVFCESDHAETSEQVESVDNVKIEYWDQKTQLYEFMKHKRMTGMLWNKLIRRSLTEDVWFNEKTGYGEDAEFLWKILKKSGKMVVTNEILYHHVLEDTSISHLSFSEKKYSAIPMWENINKEVEKEYPDLLGLAKERLMSAAIFSLYEAKNCGYKNKIHITYMRKIARKYIGAFLKSPNVSKKFKLYALAVCMGY